MPPTITPTEAATLSRVIAAVDAAQAAVPPGDHFRQARSGHDAELSALGIAAQDIADGRGSGATLDVHEYVGPDGRGYCFVLTLVRAGTTWRRVINRGPEAHRDHDWVAAWVGSIR